MSREMKYSGVEWIGEIPEDWKLKKLKNISNFINGYAFKSDDLVNEGNFPVIKIGDICNGKIDFINCNKTNENNQFLDNYIIQEKDILIAMSGATVGKLGYVEAINKRAYVNQRVGILRSKCDKFLFYILSTDLFIQYILLQSAGSAQPNISTENINNYIIPFPKLEEQQKIANFLDKKVGEIDRLIDNAKKSIEEYKKYKQSIITEAVTKGLDPNVEMKDSGIEWIGEIPKNWEFRKIKSFSDIISKGTTPKEMSTIKDSKYTIRYIKSENIVDDKLIDKPEFYITNDVNEELKRSQLTDKDILFVIAGASIGKVAIMEGDLLPANTNQAISFIRIKDEYLIYKKYLWYFLQSNIIKVVINLYSVQSAQPNLSMENIGNIKIPFPFYKNDINEIIEYLDNKCYEIENLIFKKEKLISELESYKKSLIYEYVTGKKEIL